VSSSPSALADYRAALTTPGALLPALASAVARLPIAMTTLAVLLYVQRVTGSYAIAAVVSAGTLAGESLGAVAQGRWMDRMGPMRPLLIAAGLYAVAGTGLILAIEHGAALPLLVGAAALSGLVRPAMPGASRALWGRLVPAGPRRDAAYSYEAISLEVFFILGPALAAFLVTAPWPGTGLVVAITGMVTGTTVFALSRPVRTQRPAAGGPSIGMLGALAPPGMRTVAMASLGFGLVIGSVEVGVNAVATEQGSPTLGGVLLSAWSVASVVAGILYSLRPWPRPLHLRMPFLLAAFAGCVAVMALTGPLASLPVLVVAMLAAGALITPQVTAHSLGVEATAPAGTSTEAVGWVVTAAVLGISSGQVLAGLAVDTAGAASSFLVGGVAGGVVAALLWWRRGTLTPATGPSHPARPEQPQPVAVG
jgi:MFS family permease